MDRERADTLVYYALEIGERMLVCGAEVNRVEDSITRICSAYGVERVDVFTITSSIIVTVYDKVFGSITQTRRIREQTTHLNKLDHLNRLSRTICAETPDFTTLKEALDEIDAGEDYPLLIQLSAYALISGSFTLFFGGNFLDMLASALIGVLLKFVESLFRKFQIYNSFVVILCSVFGGLMALLSVRIGLGMHADKINIGNVMLFIPGIPLMNSVRDMFQGDTISGLLKFFESALLAMCIAAGFAAASILIPV